MSNNQVTEFMENVEKGVSIEELILKTYMKIFVDNCEEFDKKRNSEKITLNNKLVIPQISQIQDVLIRDIEENALNIIYGIKESDISFDIIDKVLTDNLCEYRWSSFVCCDPQTKLYNEFKEEDDIGSANEYNSLLL